MPYLESFDKTRLYYESYTGALPYTVIVLHGWGFGCVEPYRPFREPLKDFNMFIWDARNHGKSEAREQATISDLADDLRFFLTSIYKDKYPVITIGHSMGALTLMEYVSRYGTEHISKMVFIDQSPKLVTDEEWKLGAFGNMPADRVPEMADAFSADIVKGLNYFSSFMLNKEYDQTQAMFARFTPGSVPVFTRESSRGLGNIWKSFAARDFRPYLKKIDIPTLLLYGGKSQFYLPQTGEYMRDSIPGSRLVMLPQGDHSPFVSHHDEFFQNVREFILA